MPHMPRDSCVVVIEHDNHLLILNTSLKNNVDYVSSLFDEMSVL